MLSAGRVETRRICPAPRSAVGGGWTALRRFAIIVTQHATEAFPTLDLTNLPTNFGAWIDDSILQSLMIAFKVVVGDELLQSPLQRSSAEEDHFIETLGFEGSHVAFEVGIQIWTSGRQQDDLGVGHFIHVGAQWQELGVAVDEQVARAQQESVVAREVASHLSDPISVRPAISTWRVLRRMATRM